MTWLIDNLGSIITFLILAAIVAMIIIRMKKNKSEGKSSCGCGCSSCAMKEQCHSNDKK